MCVTGDYEGALNTLTDMVNLMEERNCIDTVGKISGAFEPLASNCEISRVLLLMILQVSSVTYDALGINISRNTCE